MLVRMPVDFRRKEPNMQASKTTKQIRESLRRSAMGPNFHNSDPQGFSRVKSTPKSKAIRIILAEKVAN